MKQLLHDKVAYKTSKQTTLTYSTSFSMGIQFLGKELRKAIYNIYGFVRFADEIVDTFHDQDQKVLMDEFVSDTNKALERKFSMNPILHSFQETVHEYGIERHLIDQFIHSMKMDLSPQSYNQDKYEEYILGSAEVVGLMCLHVFVQGDKQLYANLKPYAMKLGSAFQKINFLRDLKQDYYDLGRTYFPTLNLEQFNNTVKKEIENDIRADFDEAYKGILQLPKSSRFGVYLAYKYYRQLFKKIESADAENLLDARIRIPNKQKLYLTFWSFFRHQLNLL